MRQEMHVECVLGDLELNAKLTGVGRRLAERYPLDAMVEDYVRLIEKPAA